MILLTTKIITESMFMRIKIINLLLVIALIFTLGFIAGSLIAPVNVKITQDITIKNESYSTIEMMLPAVDMNGNGVSGSLVTTVRSGTGKVLLDASNILNFPDTQLSARIAANVAAEYAKKNLNEYDVVFSIRANATVVEGPSAGSAMATSAVLAFQNRTPEKKIVMTGTINQDGSIGSVGSIAEKIKAAKESGAEMFIVPEGQNYESVYKKIMECKKLGSLEICETNYVANKEKISERLNITIVEARNLTDVMKYFVK